MPTEPTHSLVLIYGGGTATGLLAIQFAKLSDLVVIATCSSYNIDLIKNLGADAVFNYDSITVGEVQLSLLHVPRFPRNDVTNTMTLAYTAIGEDLDLFRKK